MRYHLLTDRHRFDGRSDFHDLSDELMPHDIARGRRFCSTEQVKFAIGCVNAQ